LFCTVRLHVEHTECPTLWQKKCGYKQPQQIQDLHLLEPFGYLDFLSLERHTAVIITDSGGIQEETTFLGVPCLTLRENTERPVTVEIGSNVLVGKDHTRLVREVDAILDGRVRRGQSPPLWDGHAAERIASMFATMAVS